MKFGVPMTEPSCVGPLQAAVLGRSLDVEHLRDAEVDELHDVAELARRSPVDVRREEDVVRLEVAMNDARGVRLRERLARLRDDLRRPPSRAAVRDE